jgi:dihydrofolate synthase/folylpolyglutamate synthase
MIDPSVAVITSIALDHQEWLGDSLGQIAREKAGILRPGRPLVVAQAEPPPELLQAAGDSGAAPVLLYGSDFLVATDGQSAGLQYLDQQGISTSLACPKVDGLLPQNVAAALQAVSLLGVEIDSARLRQALEGLHLTGRLQQQRVAGLDYVLDVAHNPAAVAELLDMLQSRHCEGKTLALFSAMADKDISAMLGPAVPVFDAWFLADQPGNPRAASASDTAGILRNLGESMISVSKNLRQAFRRAQSLMSDCDRLVVFGSFYTVAGVLTLLEKDRKKDLAGAVS